jgi:phage gpG-like protein
MSVTVKITNDKLTPLLEKLKQPRKFYEFLGARLKEISDKNFMAGVDWDGKPYAPNSALTNLLNAGKGIVMRRNSNLMKSVQPQVTNSALKFGSNSRYAKAHQIGMTIKAKKMLWIPLCKEAATALKHGKKIEGLFKITSKKGNILMVTAKKMTKKRKKEGTDLFKLWFTLKKFLKLPVRRFLGSPKKETIMEAIKAWLSV